jgi:acetyl-CoA synthetase
MFTEGAVIWQPNDNYINGSHLQKVIQTLGLDSYEALLEFSAENPDKFWKATLDNLGIEWFEPYQQFVDLSKGNPWPDWFVGGKINWVHNALRWAYRPESKNRTAIAWEGEDGETRQVSYAELAEEVGRFATVLKGLGVQKGDRVGLLMPMLPETAVAFLAIPSIGAIVVPMFSGFGTDAVVTRLKDSQAKVMIVADGFYRRGRKIQTRPLMEEVVKEYHNLEKVVVVRRLGVEVEYTAGRDVM